MKRKTRLSRDSAVDLAFPSETPDFFVPSFPRKRESRSRRNLDPRLRGGDEPTAESGLSQVRSTQKYKAVLFDMDGVLVNSLHAWRATVNEALRQLGYHEVARRRFKADFGQGTLADSEKYMQGRENPEDLERLYSRLFLKHIPLIRPIPRALSLLRALIKQKIKTACVTNSNRHIALQVLKQAKMFSLLDIVVAGDDVKNHKPHPEMIVLALRRLKTPAKEALMIGDSIFDCQAARAAHVSFIAFGRAIACAPLLRRLNFHLVSRCAGQFLDRTQTALDQKNLIRGS